MVYGHLRGIKRKLLQNFVDGSNIIRTELSPLLELTMTVLGMLLVATVVYRLPIWLSMPVSLGIMTSYAYGSVWAYANKLWLVDATFPVLATFLIFAQASFNNFYVQYKLREQIKKQFLELRTISPKMLLYGIYGMVL